MKLIGLFGVLLAISPVFAADPGKCAGKIPTMTVAECNGQSCTFEYAIGYYWGAPVHAFHSCNEPSLNEVDCKSLKTKDDCLSHSCSWAGFCGFLNRGVMNFLKVQPPIEITKPK